jgi:hypothetical protein
MGADQVSVLHIAPAQNLDFRRVTSRDLKSYGDTAVGVWKAMLAQPNRFMSVSTEGLFRPEIAEKYPELRLWWQYISERYSWVTKPVSA